MLLDTVFAPFVKERPICVMARAVLERLLDAPRIDAHSANPHLRRLSLSGDTPYHEIRGNVDFSALFGPSCPVFSFARRFDTALDFPTALFPGGFSSRAFPGMW